MTDKTLLIGDIGGTNARFALAGPEQPGFYDVMKLKCADFVSADAAIRHYLDDVSAGSPDIICLAGAGPVMDEVIKVTNNHWILDAVSMRAEFDIDAVHLLNDFEAVAYSISELQENDLQSIGMPERKLLPVDKFNIAIIGAGTGFGVAGLIRRANALIPIVGEGGHIGFAPKSKIQLELLSILSNDFDRINLDRLVCGPGIEIIYSALALIYGEQRAQLSAKEIFTESHKGSDPLAFETVDIFFEILGQVSGDIALCMGATDGVYLAGGIAKRYPILLQNSKFRSAFESKDRQHTYMERIPTLLITHDDPGLLGAANCALKLSSS
jgi:glucokinase